MRGQTKRRIFWFVLGVVATITAQTTVGAIVNASVTMPEPGRFAQISEDAPTVWDLVRRELHDMDPREAVYKVKKLNKGIDFGRVQIGQMIQLPKDGE